jgi:hypothetical protein
LTKFYCITYPRSENPNVIELGLRMTLGNEPKNILHLDAANFPAKRLDGTEIKIDSIGSTNYDFVLVLPSDVTPQLQKFRGEFEISNLVATKPARQPPIFEFYDRLINEV